MSSRLTLLVWMAALTRVKIIIKCLTFQPWVQDASNKGLYLSCCILMAWLIYLSCVKVNSILSMVRPGEGSNGVVFLNATPLVYTMSRCNLARHLQHVLLLLLHVQFNIHHMHRTISKVIHKPAFYIQF